MTTISAAFVKKLEHKLNACLWDAYQDLGLGQDDAVRINIKTTGGAKGGKDAVQVALPVPDKLRMPYVNRLCTAKMPKSIWCCKICGAFCLQFGECLPTVSCRA